MARFFVYLVACFLALSAAVRAETYLLMAEQAGCHYCEQWNEEIAHIYPKTDEGRAAPLRRYDIRDRVPEGVALDRSVNFTPTFLLIRDGKELGRIEGYPGQDFFWGLLTMLFERAQIAPGGAG